MTRCAYVGHEALTFTDYTDLETGQTLHAVPGGSYDVAPASGRAVPDVPQGWFTPVAIPPVTVDEELTKLGIEQIRNGISSIDEVRERLDLPPLSPDDGAEG